MNDFINSTNVYGKLKGGILSIGFMLFITGVIYFTCMGLTGIDLEPINVYFIAVLAWIPFALAGQITKFLFFEKLVKWHFWMGWKFELFIMLLFILALGFTGDAGA